MRHGHPYACPKQPSLLTTLTWEFSDGHVIEEHHHPEDQLVYASRGVMTVRTGEGTWVVPPRRAVWIPARVPHSVVMSGSVSMRTLYLRARFVRSLPRSCRVVNVSPLLRELILHACERKSMTRRRRADAHLIDLIADQLESVESVPLQLPSPADPRAARVAGVLTKDPSDSRSLHQLCRDAGASKRTIERLFQLETRMSLGQWRQQLRLLRAMQLLAAGEKITRVALDTGYSTPSAFISMFRRQVGETPRRYFAAKRAS
jgi:AraC-like DNA-binding protein